MNSTVVLSILVISHNQKEQLQRCIDSILHQSILYSYEIVISDDASIDGTWELIQEYEKQHKGLIIGVQINSSNYNPANTSQRSGYNRCNAYKIARGRYVAHVDADDYFVGNDVYQRQVEKLEEHPECSLCMQNVWILKDGDSFEKGQSWFLQGQFYDGQVISANEFILSNYFILNQAFVARKNAIFNPVELYGKRYVDSVITYHHLQFGDVIYLEKCDYVYVQYSTAITSSLSSSDQRILWLLSLYVPLLIPKFTGLFFVSGLKEMLHVVNMARKGVKLSEKSFNSVKDLNAYLYFVFGKVNLTFRDSFRLNLLRIFLIFLINSKIKNVCMLKILYRLMINSKIPKNAEFKFK